MSRSNPTSNTPNPSTRWFEWKGGDGALVWYDKEKKENVKMPNGFTFIVLDRTATVRGYNKKMQQGIHSNEVRDTRADPMVVKYFDGQVIAEGVWSEIKDTVTARKGVFTINLYIGFKDDDNELRIGCFQVKGCSLGPWFEFEKSCKLVDAPGGGRKVKEIDVKAVVIKAGAKDVSGDVEFIPPIYSLRDLDEKTNQRAVSLDVELQEYFAGYFAKPKVEQAKSAPAPAKQVHAAKQQEPEPETPDESEEVPF